MKEIYKILTGACLLVTLRGRESITMTLKKSITNFLAECSVRLTLTSLR